MYYSFLFDVDYGCSEYYTEEIEASSETEAIKRLLERRNKELLEDGALIEELEELDNIVERIYTIFSSETPIKVDRQ